MSFLVSCVEVKKDINPDTFYKRDMIIEVNGYKGIGHLVVPQSDEYEFKIEARGELDLFVFSTCHRTITIEEAGDSGIFGNKKKVKIKYKQVPGIEDEACPVVLEGYEVDKGRHSWGFVDFQEKNVQAMGILKCDGKVTKFKGVSTCQSSMGNLQEIEFEEEMQSATTENCPEAVSNNKKSFKVTLGRGLCVYGFRVIKAEHMGAVFHRLTTLGFEKIMIRKN